MTRASAWAKRKIAWGLVIALGVLYYDFWFWSDRTLVLGFMPIGLFWHALISLGAGAVFALVVRWAWPERLEQWASAEDRSRIEDPGGA